MPVGCMRLWAAFNEICAGRPQSMGGAAPIPPSEIVAWQVLMGVTLTPWEVETIFALDRAVLRVMRESSAGAAA